MPNNASLIFSAVVLLLNGIVTTTIFYRFKKDDSRKEKIFDIRYSDYKYYIRKLEEISESLRSELFISFIDDTMASYQRINAGGGQPELNTFIEKMFGVLKSVNDFYSKGTSELDGLRLVASPKIYAMVNEFIKELRDILQQSSEVMGLMKNPELHTQMKELLSLKGKQAELLRENIIIEMRHELGFD